MSDRPAPVVIPILDARSRPIVVDGLQPLAEGSPRDTRGRPLHDLRISVTDRCNFRCTYCMPKEVFDRDYTYLRHADLLTFEEIARLARTFVGLGVRKIRLTGGEPLLRKDIERLVAMLARIEVPGRPDETLDLTLTTNGALLRKKARALREAGLGRVTVSLDALDDTRFRAMNDVDFPVATVLDGIAAAAEAGLGPVKVNMVVKRGVNDDQILAMAERFRGTGHILRLIEFMDVGSTNQWKLDEVLPSAEAVRMIAARFPIEPVAANYPGEVAERWRYRDGAGEIGFISSVTQPFCGDCSRARLSPEGSLYTCLFGTEGRDLRGLLRGGIDDARIAAAVAGIWSARDDRYSELREAGVKPPGRHVEMSHIGG